MSLLTKGARGVTRLSELEIDADKDWGGRGISNLKEVTSGMNKGDIIYQGLAPILDRLPPIYGVGTSFLHVKSLGGGVFVPEWADIQSVIAYITAGLNRLVTLAAMEMPVPVLAKIVVENHSGGGFTELRFLSTPIPAVAKAVAEDHSGGGVASTPLLAIAVPSVLNDATVIYEKYQTGDDESRSIFGANWEAQTFTPGAAHSINRVNLKLARFGNPGTVTVGIWATGAGLPSSPDLVSATFDGNALATSALWKLTVITAQPLLAGTKYAIVVRATSGDVNNYLMWRSDVTSPTHTGGARCYSSDSGATWIEDTTRDFIFEEGVGQA